MHIGENPILEDFMAKESKHRRDERKKPSMSLKERRAKKHEKKRMKHEHQISSEGPVLDM
jgi:hypothetical protein